jgi:multidrug efflux pump subunit AcrA (membrane-fusion protein)
VRDEKGQHFVFVYDGDEVHRREIQVGVASDKKYELISGLALGDRVALPTDVNLKDGMKVRVMEAK